MTATGDPAPGCPNTQASSTDESEIMLKCKIVDFFELLTGAKGESITYGTLAAFRDEVAIQMDWRSVVVRPRMKIRCHLNESHD